ncbi:mechanosensitive ion channel family protein [[Mycobacterium] burgundiense]|uniref:Mechanosensitive ion channel family protein n=1 Tax=[Mycobacterium] burgundiense TaxID=3064286 RepID=A0ABM9LQX7_9MYCO|nr:mechanosensitive ion channel family protein [Mycolicibacterium sp. MU0053]CAJ1503216.1 mechanosensitive ion channel family protein [Mycolicibacterium sp. MU0053]
MSSLFGTSWLYWAIAVAVGLPALLVILTELHHVLAKRGSHLARPVNLIRIYVLPLGALLLLMVKASDVSPEATSVRMVATALGFMVLILLLSGTNATLFQRAPEGSWRKRIPSIFLDVARVVLIVLGLALIFSYIWGANVGGLFAALGVTSIVLGLALQNSVGQIISGLLMLFEQPFQLGDWLDTPAGRGRVREVNWRSVHIETGDGLTITPNSVLAGASFTNLSRPASAHRILVETTFGASDPPDRVCAVLNSVAAGLPHRGEAEPTSVPLGGNAYRTSIPLRSPADDGPAKAAFLRWLWYAARRADLHLDGAADDYSTEQRRWEALQTSTRALRLTPADQRSLLEKVRLIRYGADEQVQAADSVPDSMKFVVSGRVRVQVPAGHGGQATVRVLETGDFLGQTTLTREPVAAGAVAVGEVAMLEMDREVLESLVTGQPGLLHEIGRVIDERRRDVAQAGRPQVDVN